MKGSIFFVCDKNDPLLHPPSLPISLSQIQGPHGPPTLWNLPVSLRAPSPQSSL